MTELLKNILFCLKISWKSSPKYTLLRILHSIYSSISPIIILGISKRLFDIFVYQSANSTSYFYAVLLISVSFIFSILLNITGKSMFNIQIIHDELSEKCINTLMMEKSMDVDIDFFDTPDYMNLMQNARTDIRVILNHIWNTISLLNSFFTFILAFLSLGIQNWITSSTVTIVTIPAAFFFQRYTKKIFDWKISKTAFERKKNYLQLLSSARGFAPEIRLFELKHFIIDKFKKISEPLIYEHKKILNKALFPILLVSVIPEITIFLIMLHLVNDVLSGIRSFGEFTLINGLLLTLNGSINSLITAITGIFQDTLSLNMIRSFLLKKSELKSDGNLVLEPPFDIEFKNVSFKYPRTSRTVLNNLSFSIKYKEKVFILGKNGCGKSTIIKLLLRQYDVTEGEILFNGKNINEYTIESIRKCFSTLFQNYEKYAFTLRENIEISDLNRNDVSDFSVQNMIKMAGGEDFLHRINNNLNVTLSRIFSEDGIELSGGETQKIAIARAIYKDSPVILFDEPSSNLDSISEHTFLNEYVFNTPQKTLIIITHRIHGAMNADKIIVMDNGHLIEMGSHQQLMENNKFYCKMVKQSEE